MILFPAAVFAGYQLALSEFRFAIPSFTNENLLWLSPKPLQLLLSPS